MHIPFVDLKAQYQSLKSEIDRAIQNVIDDCAFIGTSNNKYVKAFEADFANFMGTTHCIGCANGTDSLEILLKGLGIGPGDEVIVPALSWIATSESVSNMGAKPVFVDIEPDFYTIDPQLIEEKITPATKAIIPVHLYGHPADMDAIMAIAKKHRLKVIEDCAQSHGASINGKLTGTIGDAGSFSFFPGKNLGAYGDAGGMVTNNDLLADRCRMISQHGQLNKKHHHLIEGRNSRLDGIQAAILSVKLLRLNQWTDQRIAIAAQYNRVLPDWIKKPQTRTGYKHVFHLYVMEAENRDAIMQTLKDAGIESAIQYPTPLPLLDAYKNQGFSETDFPVASRATKRILSLPVFPELTFEQIGVIASIVEKE